MWLFVLGFKCLTVNLLGRLKVYKYSVGENMMKKINKYGEIKTNETPTKCICHKWFSGYLGVVARSNFRVGGQESNPHSLTAHTLDRYAHIRKNKRV